MKIMSVAELKSLMDLQESRCASIYLSLSPSGEPANQVRIKLKNALKELDALLDRDGWGKARKYAFMEPLKTVLADTTIGKNINTSLAVFRSSAGMRYIWLPNKVKDLVVLSDRFHIKPLIRFYSGEDLFLLLALSLKQVRLFRCSRYTIGAVENAGMPLGLKEALNYEEREKTLQRPHGGASGMGPVHGTGYELMIDDIIKYFRIVDKTVLRVLPDMDLPLLIAAVEREIPLYMKISSYPNIVERGLPGNPDGLSERELHDSSMKVMEPYFIDIEEKAVSEYHEKAGSGKTSRNLMEILPMASEGRIRVLFVAEGHTQWGRFGSETGDIEMHNEKISGDQDLLDLASYHTLLAGGRVYVLDSEKVPGGTLAAAIYRY